jgi:hypothetical protein
MSFNKRRDVVRKAKRDIFREERMTGGGNVSSSDNLEERQWMNRGEDKLFGNVSCMKGRLGGGDSKGSRGRGSSIQPCGGESLEKLNIVEIGRSLHKHKHKHKHKHQGWDQLRVRLCRCFRTIDRRSIGGSFSQGVDDHFGGDLWMGPNMGLGRNAPFSLVWLILRQAKRPKEEVFDSTLEHQTLAYKVNNVIRRKVARSPPKKLASCETVRLRITPQKEPPETNASQK